jgi:hypothetical protein
LNHIFSRFQQFATLIVISPAGRFAALYAQDCITTLLLPLQKHTDQACRH